MLRVTCCVLRVTCYVLRVTCYVLRYVTHICMCILYIYIHIISYHIISYHIISYHLISSHLISYHIISDHIISYHIISYHIISYHIISYHIISYHIISYHIISYHIISYHIISYHIISYHITSYLCVDTYDSRRPQYWQLYRGPCTVHMLPGPPSPPGQAPESLPKVREIPQQRPEPRELAPLSLALAAAWLLANIHEGPCFDDLFCPPGRRTLFERGERSTAHVIISGPSMRVQVLEIQVCTEYQLWGLK